jgi:hypothetical protein
VRLGEYNTKTNPDCGEGTRDDFICAPPVIDVNIAQTIVHENYNDLQHNDIALLQVDQFIQFNDFIKPICLPLDKSQFSRTDGLHFVVSGFGRTERQSSSSIKLKTEVSGVDNAECQRVFDKRQIIYSQLCAGGSDNKDSWLIEL